jgi:hypothetical protein
MARKTVVPVSAGEDGVAPESLNRVHHRNIEHRE